MSILDERPQMNILTGSCINNRTLQSFRNKLDASEETNLIVNTYGFLMSKCNMHALYEEYDLASFWTVRTFCTENALTLLYTKENKCNQTTWWVSTIAAARGRGVVGHPPVRS